MRSHDTKTIQAALDHVRRVATESGGSVTTELARGLARRFDVSERTIWRWFANGAPIAHEQRSLSDEILTAVAQANGNLKRAWEALSADGIYELSYRQFVRDFDRVDPILRVGLTQGTPAALQHGLYLKGTSTGRLDRVIFDHTEADIYLQREFAGKSETFRPWISLLLDSHTRMILACIITEGDGLKGDPGTESIIALLAVAIRGSVATDGTFVGGVPKLVQFDNAKAHLAEAMLNGYVELGIASLAIKPGSPWEDGRVERLMLTFKEELLSTLPGYTAALKDRYNRHGWTPEECMTVTEFQAHLEFWIDHYNYERIHSSLGSTPFEAWRDDQTAIERVSDDLIRHNFLAEKNGRKISKNGVRFKNIDYVHPAMSKMVGKKVSVRYLPNDRTFLDVFVEGTYVCTAVPHERLSTDERLQIVRKRNSQTAKVERIRKRSRKRASDRTVLGNPLLSSEHDPELPARRMSAMDDEDFLRFAESSRRDSEELADDSE